MSEIGMRILYLERVVPALCQRVAWGWGPWYSWGKYSGPGTPQTLSSGSHSTVWRWFAVKHRFMASLKGYTYFKKHRFIVLLQLSEIKKNNDNEVWNKNVVLLTPVQQCKFCPSLAKAISVTIVSNSLAFVNTG